MMRLVRKGLMFGNLIEVTSPALVERYNRALKHLIDKETALNEFHIDIAGYSPEIGDELGDDLYLNPKGCNQMFILLTTDQKTAPLLNSKFSTSRSILREYIEENEDQLFALTAREAVAGELLNSVFDMSDPSDLLQINQIEIEADTIQEHVAEANQLGEQIERFMSEDDAWWDDVLIAQMIELAKRTGNIQRNPVKLDSKIYRQGNYYTNHFGGIYVFRDAGTPTIIAREPVEGLKDILIEQILTFEDRDGIANFLRDEGLSQLIVQSPNQHTAGIIKQKIDFITITTAAEQGHNLAGLTRQNVRLLERRFADAMPAEYHGLMDVWRWASLGGRVPKLKPEHPAFFYALRSSQHKDRDLVNMLLSDLSRLDFRQLFICNKPLFYETYRGWSEPKKEYVASFLADEYAMDKVGAREALFGDEPMMEEPEVTPPQGRDEPTQKSSKSKKPFRSPWGEAHVDEGLYRLRDTRGEPDDFRELYKDYRKKNYRKKKKRKDD
jgi:hypothetical protein